MTAVVLVIHLILALAIIVLVLLQRSEGGGLGMGSSGGLGSLASPQTTASALSRATGICAGLFFVTSLTLAVLAGQGRPQSIADRLDAAPAATEQAAEKPAEEKPKAAPSVPVAE